MDKTLLSAGLFLLIAISNCQDKMNQSKGDRSQLEPPTDAPSHCYGGNPGIPGLNGMHGKDGMPGASGVSGPMGVQGPQGRPGEAGIRGRKGDQGGKGVNGVSGEPGSGHKGKKGEPGGRIRTSRHVRTNVAFSVSRTNKLGPVIEDTAVIFDKIWSNVGKGFNTFTSEFEVKTNGTYIFHLHVMSQEDDNCYAWIMRNGVHLTPVYGDARNGYGTGSTTVILDLAAEDKIWIQLSQDSTLMNDYTTFSGYLLA